jgi:hypothetical protein
MKSIGFKTFEPYINESYDMIDDPEERYQACINSLTDFLNSPYPRDEVNEIAEHNIRFFYSDELYLQLTDTLINEIINNYSNCRERDDFEFRKDQ